MSNPYYDMTMDITEDGAVVDNTETIQYYSRNPDGKTYATPVTLTGCLREDRHVSMQQGNDIVASDHTRWHIWLNIWQQFMPAGAVPQFSDKIVAPRDGTVWIVHLPDRGDMSWITRYTLDAKKSQKTSS